MEKAKPILGILAMVFGAMGVLLSLAALIGVWVVNKPLTDETLQLLDSVESSLILVDEQVILVDQSIREVQTRFQARVEGIDFETLQTRLTNLIALVDGAESAINMAGNVMQVTNTLRFGRAADESIANTDELVTKLEWVSLALASVQENVTALQEGRAESGVLVQINTVLVDLLDTIETIDSRIDNALNLVLQLQQGVSGWVDLASVMLTLLLVWIGSGQMSLFDRGRMWFVEHKRSEAVD